MRFSTPQWNLTLGIDGVLTAGRFLRLRAMVWAAALFAGALFFFFASISMGTWAHLPRRANYLVASVVPCLAFVSYAWAVRIGEHRRAIEVVPVWRSALEFLAGAAIGFMMISVTLAVLWLFGLYSVHVSHWTNALDSFVFDSYISGMMEELAFRAILLRLLARGLGPLYGLIASSILFGAAHLSHATWLAAFEVAFNGGMVMGLLYMMTGRIWMSVGMHIAWDFTEESLLGVNSKTGLLLSTPVAGQPDILSGGNYGPDGSILAGIVGTIAILGIWYISARKKPSGSSLEAIAVIGRRDSDPVTKPCAKGAPCISVRAMAAHEKPAVRKSLNCRNCGVSAPDHYCPHCGQETREDPPSFREFVHEFILHYFAAEGRLWNTLAALVLHPGRLTIDYLRGRKLAYVLPLRLYLTVSVVFFLLLKIAAAPGNERVAAAFHRSLNDGQSSFAIVDLGFARAIRNADGSFDCNLATWFCNRIKDRLLREPGAFENKVTQVPTELVSHLSTAVFLLLPLFALYLQIAYRKPTYGEHFLFALHVHSFWFLVLMVLLLPVPGWAQSVLAGYIFLYTVMALHAVYGSGWFGAVLKGTAIGMAHIASLLLATITIALWTLLD